MCQIIAQRSLLRQLYKLILLQFLIFAVYPVKAGNVPLPLGVVFEPGNPEIESSFKHALLTFNLNITSNPRDLYRFTAYVDTINTADAFKLSKLICSQLSRSIYSLIYLCSGSGPESFNTYHAFANTFSMPIITPSWYHKASTGKNDLADYTTILRPDLNPAILDTIRYYQWKDIIYLYSTNEGLLRLQTLFYRSSNSDMLRVKLVKRIANAKDAITILRDVESAERFSHKYILLDCPTDLAKDIIIKHVQNVNLGRRTYHYMLAGMAFDETWDSNTLEFNAVNITGFRMVDPSRRYVQEFLQKWSALDTAQFPGAGKDSISGIAALTFDAQLVIKEAFTDILTDNPYALKRYGVESACDSGSDFLDDVRPFEYGQLVNQHLRRVQTEGLTGNIQFHENGTRKYFSVDVIELRENSTKVKIGQWSDFAGFRKEHSTSEPSVHQELNYKKVYVISSILEEPYLKLKKPVQGKTLLGNDMYEGYIKDLADLIFQTVGLKYRIKLVRDGKYGSKILTDYGESWNGIIGELIRKEADLSLAPLTITAERERVIEFTKPFLSQGISIMAYKPKKSFPGMFSFMNPLSNFVWLSVLGAYLCVTGVLYIIYKLTAANQRQLMQRINDEYVSKYPNPTGNTFIQNPTIQIQQRPPESLSLSNMLWMSFSILSHQPRGNALIQRSIATRLASTVWWLFALILVSMYTGNYIAIRMRNRVSSPIRSAWDLVDHSGIQYGTLQSGSTYDFLKNSENQVYRAMFQHISGPNQLNLKTYEEGINTVRQKKGKYAFILETVKNEFVSNRKPCNTVKIGPDLTDIHFGIGLPIGSPLAQKLNLEILKLKESGVLSKLEDKWWMSKAECNIVAKLDEMESSITDDELSLGSLAGIFYVLIIGMVVAILVSFLEFFCRSKKEAQMTTSSEAMVQIRSVHPNTVIGTVPNDFRDIPTDLSSK